MIKSILAGILLGMVTPLILLEPIPATVSIKLSLPPYQPKPVIYGKEFSCIAETVYGESRGEPFEGQVQVALTVISRIYSPRFPDHGCLVVRQKNQFAGYWAAKGRKNPQVEAATMKAALEFFEHEETLYFDSVKNPSKFHRKLPKVVAIASHNFYGAYGNGG